MNENLAIITTDNIDSLLDKAFGRRAEEQLIYELDIIEPYLSGLPNLAQMTNAIYFKTFEKVFSENPMINLQPYSGSGEINQFKQIENADSLLSFFIPKKEDSIIPDWYLVLNVRSFRLINYAPWTNIGLLTKTLHTEFESDLFLTRISYQLLVVDSKTKKILFEEDKRHVLDIENSSSVLQIVENNKDAWPKEFIDIIVQSASSDAASILLNRQIFTSNDISKGYALAEEKLLQILRELSSNK